MRRASPESGDASLVKLALGGEERAFTLLMRRHKGRVYRYVRSYGADADEAYDLTQETFVAAWKALFRYDRRRPFASWILRIALNECRDWSRRRAVRRFFFGARSIDEADIEIPAPAAEPDDTEARLDALEAAIASLPGPLKEPLLLTAIGGHSQKEAAAVLGISVKAVETRLYRARALLLAALKPPTDDNGAQ